MYCAGTPPPIILPVPHQNNIKFKIERPDYITITGANVIAGMIVQNRDLNITTEQKTNPQTIEVDNIPGMGTVTVRWIVRGSGKYGINVDSRKGGVVSRSK